MTIVEVENKIRQYSADLELRWKRYQRFAAKRSPMAATEYREYMSRWALLEKYKKELSNMKKEQKNEAGL